MNVLDIKGPEDVKRLPREELPALAKEMRRMLIEKLHATGGHAGPNLGFVEATIALHRVFNSPTDKIVFDVSHQCYPHKMLTGRMQAFADPAHYGDVSGYTAPAESPHDQFVVGHTSTSVSLATGLAKARDLRGESYNVIAVIGDGSLSGGEAFEGLDNLAEQGTNAIVVVNDNQMSIAENHGGLYASLARLRESNGADPLNYFKVLGLDYRYVADGNDIDALEAAFRDVKDIDHPVVVHINTEKGRGYAPAIVDKEGWHWTMPGFDVATGAREGGEWIGTRVADHLLAKMKENPRLVVINAAVPITLGFDKARRMAAGRQYVDVGICEEHACAFASGIAKGGARPVWGVVSTFIQRTYDQISQDLCLNENPAVILVTMASLMGMNDATHIGFFDIPLLISIPNLVYLCPTCEKEYFAMMDWAISQTAHPIAIRQPENGVMENDVTILDDYADCGYEVTHRGRRVAIIGLGNFYKLGGELREALAAKGIDATLINPRGATVLDVATLDALTMDHEIVVTLEDGVVDGGFGEKIARYYGPSEMKVLVKGAAKKFADRYDYTEILKDNGLTVEQIVAQIWK